MATTRIKFNVYFSYLLLTLSLNKMTIVHTMAGRSDMITDNPQIQHIEQSSSSNSHNGEETGDEQSASNSPEIRRCETQFVNTVSYGLRFNEIFLKNSGMLGSKEFIELKSVEAKKARNLQYHKIIGIVFDTILGKPTIDLVINLHNFKTNERGFFTVGGKNIIDADLRDGNEPKGLQGMVKYKGSSLYRGTLDKDKLPYGLLMVIDKTMSIKFSSQSKAIDTTLEHIIKDGIIDLVVFRHESSGAEYHSFFENIFPPFREKRYTLRGTSLEMSLSRCDQVPETEQKNFVPELFKESQPTPGEDNNCQAANFILLPTTTVTIAEEQEEQIHRQEQKIHRQEEQIHREQVESRGHEESEIEEDNSNLETSTCSKNDNSVQETVQLQSIDRQLNVKTINEWESTCFFQEKWIQHIDQFQNDLISTVTIKRPDVMPWFELLINGADPHESRYRCRLCYRYSKEINMASQLIPDIAKENGQLKNSKKKNQEKIVSHAKSPIHREVIKLLKKRKLEELPNNFQRIQRRRESQTNGMLQSTTKMIRTVYTEIRAGIALNNHPLIVQLQEMNGVSPFYHHKDDHSAARMVKVISTSMHKELMDHLRKKKSALSIILDTSTDITNKHYLICYFSVIENNNVRTKLYKLIRLGIDEDADALFNHMINEFEKDGIETYMQENLVGYITDGARVFRGHINSVMVKFQNWIKPKNRKLIAIHCMAHRLELSLAEAFKEFTSISDIEKLLNEIHKFYFSSSHKRAAHLEHLAEELDEIMYRYSAIFEHRWIPSVFEAVRKLVNSWKLLVHDLELISSSDEMVDNFLTIDKAKGLLAKLKGKYFLVNLHFFNDLLRILSTSSKEMQSNLNTLVDEEETLRNLLESLETLKTQDGISLKVFLKDCKRLPNIQSCNTVNNYESHVSVMYEGRELLQDGGRINKLSDIRIRLISAIIDQINLYFPTSEIRHFRIFSPSLIPTSRAQCNFYGIDEIYEICKIIGYETNCQNIINSWHNLLCKIIAKDNFDEERCGKVRDFWLLQLVDRNLPWTPELEFIIQAIITTPVGSAEAERGVK